MVRAAYFYNTLFRASSFLSYGYGGSESTVVGTAWQQAAESSRLNQEQEAERERGEGGQEGGERTERDR